MAFSGRGGVYQRHAVCTGFRVPYHRDIRTAQIYGY